VSEERNAQIQADRAAGLTYKAIGQKYGLTHQRAAQICLHPSPPPRTTYAVKHVINGRRQTRRLH
jgi:hypothetical protein